MIRLTGTITRMNVLRTLTQPLLLQSSRPFSQYTVSTTRPSSKTSAPSSRLSAALAHQPQFALLASTPYGTQVPMLIPHAPAMEQHEWPTLQVPIMDLSALPSPTTAHTSSSSSSSAEGLQLESTKRKRVRKMNKHKWKKRLKAQRNRTRKDLAQ